MDDTIELYIQESFTEEFQALIKKAFSLFDFFELNTAPQTFIDVLALDDNIEKEDLHDLFVKTLNDNLNKVLKAHTIVLTSEATVFEKVKVCDALGRLQHLEDYTAIIRTLESFEPDDEQLAFIISSISDISEIRCLEIIEDFDISILRTLKDYIYSKEANEEYVDPYETDIEHDKLMKLYLNHTENSLGTLLIQNGVLTGSSFETYVPFIKDFITVGKPEVIAKNFLSIIYLSSDGYKSPLETYRKYSLEILKDLNVVTPVESELIKQIGLFEEYRKVQSEKDRLSKVSNPA